MVERIYTLLSRLIVRLVPGPRRPMRRSWWWLATHTDDPAERERCFERVLDIDARRGPAFEVLIDLWRSAPDGQKGDVARQLRRALKEQESAARG
jgi:hypothetical protein